MKCLLIDAFLSAISYRDLGSWCSIRANTVWWRDAITISAWEHFCKKLSGRQGWCDAHFDLFLWWPTTYWFLSIEHERLLRLLSPRIDEWYEDMPKSILIIASMPPLKSHAISTPKQRSISTSSPTIRFSRHFHVIYAPHYWGEVSAKCGALNA